MFLFRDLLTAKWHVFEAGKQHFKRLHQVKGPGSPFVSSAGSITKYQETEPKWALFFEGQPIKQGLFQAKQGSFGFQVANEIKTLYFQWNWKKTVWHDPHLIVSVKCTPFQNNLQKTSHGFQCLWFLKSEVIDEPGQIITTFPAGWSPQMVV